MKRHDKLFVKSNDQLPSINMQAAKVKTKTSSAFRTLKKQSFIDKTIQPPTEKQNNSVSLKRAKQE